MDMRAVCWSIGSAYESLTVDDAKTIKSRPSPASQFMLMNFNIIIIIAYSVYKCHCNTRAHTTRTHIYIGVHLLTLRALRLVQYEFAVSAIWMWLVQYEFAVSAIWHIFYLAAI